jgi:hypothetical protein
MDAITAFALASMLHAGFQLTVTALVYPALSTRGSEEWAGAHARHTRTIAPLVAVVYGALVATGAALVVSGPTPAGWLALGGAATAITVTVTLAAPLHGRLTPRDDVGVARLLTVDRWRCVAALAGAAAALVAVW